MDTFKNFVRSEKFQNTWKDPVWSKVISAMILILLSLIFTLFKLLWDYLEIGDSIVYVSEFVVSSLKSFSNYIDNLFDNKYIFLFIKILFWLGIIFSAYKFFYEKTKHFWRKFFKEDPNTEDKIHILREYPLHVFANKFAKAFPSINGIHWFENSEEAAHRLEVLLKKPIRYQHTSNRDEFTVDIFWWYRGFENMYISDFSVVNKSFCLLDDYYELNIGKIAVYRSNISNRNYVYVETSPSKKTGLYEGVLQTESPYEQEPYAIFGKKLISIGDYEDGATVINGKVVSIEGAKNRLRYISKYNFIITSQLSPYNNDEFDEHLDKYLNGVLTKKHTYQELFDFMNSCSDNKDRAKFSPDPFSEFLG